MDLTLTSELPHAQALAALLRCPRCRTPVERRDDAYHCASGHRYPIVLGIPDFRLGEDPLIPLEEDYRKGEKLEAAGRELSFEELVRYYWSLPTHPPTPGDLSARFLRHVLSDERRIEGYGGLLGRGNTFLDVGCGAGMLLRSAHRWFRTCIGVDIGFRWLIVARKGLREAGLPANLVCCGADRLPFPEGVFDTVTAVSLLEHAPQAESVLQEAARVLTPEGRLFVWTSNRYSLAPEPHVRVWGVGFLPRRWMAGYVRWRRGMSYEGKHLLSRRELARQLNRAGLGDTHFVAPEVTDADLEQMRGVERLAALSWRVIRRIPLLSRLLLPLFPVLQVVSRRWDERAAT